MILENNFHFQLKNILKTILTIYSNIYVPFIFWDLATLVMQFDNSQLYHKV